MIQLIKKLKKNFNKELLANNKRDEISDGSYARLRSTGGQPARIYGPAKVHKKHTTLQTVLSFSLFGSSFENLNKTQAIFF